MCLERQNNTVDVQRREGKHGGLTLRKTKFDADDPVDLYFFGLSSVEDSALSHSVSDVATA